MDFVNSKIFPYLVAAAAGAVAISAAFFSVFGLSKLFAGAQTSVVIMAGSLEFAKLVTASFLYRYWKTVPTFLKNYLLVGTLILILITSAGIFGYLSNAYQGATTEFEKQSTVLMFKEDRLEQLNEDKIFLKQELEDAIAELPDNYRTARKKLREEYQPKIDEINQATLNVKQEIGVIAANMAFEIGAGVPVVSKQERKKKKRWWEMYKEEPKEIPIYTEEDEKRMDIIGQNGNDGAHYEEELPKGAVDLREINKKNEKK